jgi:hypothetical protein
MNEFTFCLKMPEEAHYTMEGTLYNKCNECRCKLEAYRRITDDVREVKIKGPHLSIESLKKFLIAENITQYIVKRP